MEFGKESFRTFEQGITKEWLLTNGIGGFCSSTIIGANTRRYHGLLVASLKPPVQRHLVLSKVDESIEIDGKNHILYTNKTIDHLSKGYLYLQHVSLDPLPVFTYSVRDVFIEKRICMVYGKNTVCIVYRILNGAEASTLRLAPLVNFRDYHGDSSRNHMVFDFTEVTGGIFITPYHLDLNFRILISEGNFVRQEDNWFYNMDYPMERERGLHSYEDHFIPGFFEVRLKPFEEKQLTVMATMESEAVITDGRSLIAAEEQRMSSLAMTLKFKDDFTVRLARAADQFIVYRESTGSKTILAGYPWFTDWGRDTMIAFTGLTLATGRFSDARQILHTFSRYVKDGLIPNMFPDHGEEPPYNSVDAALWFFEAAGKYVDYTGDLDFIREEIFPCLKSILQAFEKGTRFKIRMDSDYLITAGDESMQLTWMDAKVGDWVVTPRHGKAVEINALWYNALELFASLCLAMGENAGHYKDLAEKVRESFHNQFWFEEGGYLYDVITEDYKDASMRPNQILALSLSYPVLDGEKARSVILRVWQQLYTPYGLRSLSPEDIRYRGYYSGDQFHRDGAYHQGTVWTWLTGRFITAFMRYFGHEKHAHEVAMNFILPFKDHLKDACIGSISEIFDGDTPYTPRGCFAQAWSVAEILRTYVEDLQL